MKNAIIMVGLPCSGKTSWILEQPNLEGYIMVSADSIKENHPDYDPNDNEPLHEWSVEQAELKMIEISDIGSDVIMDGGGINNRYTIRIINMLHEKDYNVGLIHVKTPWQVCLERNKKRLRKVPSKSITDKSIKEASQVVTLSELADEVEVVDYYTNKHLFVDMDGVIAAQSVLPIIDGCIDFVNGEIHKHQKPVEPVISKLKNLWSDGYTLYILSATPNSFSTAEKQDWLNKHFNVDVTNRFFVNQGKHKAEMLDNLSRKLKLNKSDVTMIDDTHSILYDVRSRGMNSMHISEFLTHEF